MTDIEIFDRKQIDFNKRRAAAGIEAHDFLHRYAADELVTRLGAISREFRLIADVGAGHGVLSARIAEAWPEARLISVEPSVQLARRLPGNVVRAHEDALPLRNESFDLIVSGLALHLVNDLPGTLIQIRRALKPDGLFFAALLGGDTLIELREALMLAEAEITGGMSPRVFPTADVRSFGALLQRAGFALPVADTERLTVTYETPLALMKELRAMGASNAMTARSRKPLRRSVLARACEIYAERASSPGGRVSATFDFIYLSGWAPHESQQKPLRPGSAAVRLADALNTVEYPAGDKASFPLSKKPSR